MPATVASLPSATAVAGSDSYDGCTKPTDTAKPPGKATVGTSSSYVATEPSGACVVMMRRGAGRPDMACVRVGGGSRVGEYEELAECEDLFGYICLVFI
jgi:hypothetical protein